MFRDEQHLRQHVLDWLDGVANVRTHGTTGESPRERFARDELALLKPYLSPSCVTAQAHTARKVDKTGLISWKANKYSVPMTWQQSRVGVQESGNQLQISDLQSGEVIARHELTSGKGQLIKNTHHYPDHTQRREQLEQDIQTLIGDESVSQALCQQLQLSLPNGHDRVATPNDERPCPLPSPQPSPRGRGGERALCDFHTNNHGGWRHP